MDYEKKYNEALEKARQLCAYPTTTPFISDLQDLFPELAESEDEKIRKAIVNAIHNYAYRLEEKIPTEWLTWLEKQTSTMWTEEDEIHVYNIIHFLEEPSMLENNEPYKKIVIEWLKSLKGRIQKGE